MIFAAGLGTRLKPLTDKIPKALVPVAGKPLLEHLILKLKSAGFNQIMVNVHHFPDQIKNFLKTNRNFGIKIAVSDEKEMLLDTGGGLRKAQDFFEDKPFLAHNVDILSNLDISQLMQVHQSRDLATLVVSRRETTRYFLFNKENKLCGWIHKQTGVIRPPSLLSTTGLSELAFSGIQILSPRIFERMDMFPPKFSIVDFYMENCLSESIKAYVPQNYQMVDVGKINSLDEAESFMIHTYPH